MAFHTFSVEVWVRKKSRHRVFNHGRGRHKKGHGFQTKKYGSRGSAYCPGGRSSLLFPSMSIFEGSGKIVSRNPNPSSGTTRHRDQVFVMTSTESQSTGNIVPPAHRLILSTSRNSSKHSVLPQGMRSIVETTIFVVEIKLKIACRGTHRQTTAITIPAKVNRGQQNILYI